MKTKQKRTHKRGICPVCGTSQKLQADGTIGGHPLNRYLPDGPRCEGRGQQPMDLAPKSPKVGHTYVAILLDDSSSMNHLRSETVDAFNRVAQPLREQDDTYHVSFYKFDEKWKPSLVFSDRSPKSIPTLTREEYNPQGGTALHCAVLGAVADFRYLGDETSSYLLLVVTDGHDQHSFCHGIRSHDVHKKLAELQATGRWTVAVSGPKHAERLASEWGIPAGNITTWEQTKAGAVDMGVRTGAAVRGFTHSRSKGETSVKNFYEVLNVGRTSVDTVRANLTESDARDFRKLVVKKAQDIRETVEDAKLSFSPGCAYYELQKPERIQGHKKVILELRQDGVKRSALGPVFANDSEVREVLKIPAGASGKIEPGNLGEWIVWVQSTSTNRKVLAKQRVLYRK